MRDHAKVFSFGELGCLRLYAKGKVARGLRNPFFGESRRDRQPVVPSSLVSFIGRSHQIAKPRRLCRFRRGHVEYGRFAKEVMEDLDEHFALGFRIRDSRRS
jgi:hypothetical protein